MNSRIAQTRSTDMKTITLLFIALFAVGASTVFWYRMLVKSSGAPFALIQENETKSSVVSIQKEPINTTLAVKDSQGQTSYGDALREIYAVAPKADEIIKSPLIIKGEAKGSWFFSGYLSIVLEDNNGEEVGSTVARAQGDWTTSAFVPFEATLSFTTPPSSAGKLIFMKANPSGLAQRADALEIPVQFK